MQASVNYPAFPLSGVRLESGPTVGQTMYPTTCTTNGRQTRHPRRRTTADLVIEITAKHRRRLHAATCFVTSTCGSDDDLATNALKLDAGAFLRRL